MLNFFKNFDNVFKDVVLIAIGYLIYSVLGIFNMSSKNIQKIEDSQKLIMQNAKDIIAHHDKNARIADSLDNYHIKQIEELNTQLKDMKAQLKKVETEITNYKTTFDNNKVDLPNPFVKDGN